MFKPVIRPMVVIDRSSVIDILNNTEEFTAEEVTVAIELCDYYLKESYKSGYHIYVADIDGIVKGYVCFGPTPLTKSTWDIYWVAVSKDFKGKGIGSLLLKIAESNILEANGNLVLIETSSKANYEDARQFYIHNKYNLIARVPNFYEQFDDKIIFGKQLL